MKNRAIRLMTGVLAGLLAVSLAACGPTSKSQEAKSATSGQQADANKDSKDAKDAKDEHAGHSHGAPTFEEIPIGQDQEVGPLNVAAVYFQPVDMYPAGMGLSAAESNLHLEADIHALKDNGLGFGAGDFVPSLTVKYRIEDKNDPNNKQDGTLMGMNAADGPHYGANIKLDKDGQYKLTFIIESPEKNGWTLHVDPDTGVPSRFWTEPLEASFDWDYTVHQW